MPDSRTDKKWEVVILGIVAVVALLIALIIGLTITDGEPGTASSTPLISMLVALIPLTITSLLALLRTNDARKEANEAKHTVEVTQKVVEQTRKDLANGVLTANMRQAIRAVAHEDDISISPGERTPPKGLPRRDYSVDPTEGEIPGAPGQHR